MRQETIIGFENYRFECLIGIEPHERSKEQSILVDLKVGVDCNQAVISENIQDTIDYTHLARICKDVAQEGRFQLLESYVSKALDEILSQFNVRWVWMRVKKPLALPGADFTFVEMKKESK